MRFLTVSIIFLFAIIVVIIADYLYYYIRYKLCKVGKIYKGRDKYAEIVKKENNFIYYVVHYRTGGPSPIIALYYKTFFDAWPL